MSTLLYSPSNSTLLPTPRIERFIRQKTYSDQVSYSSLWTTMSKAYYSWYRTSTRNIIRGT